MNVDISKWKADSVHELLTELQNEEAKLVEVQGRLQRWLHVAKARIHRDETSGRWLLKSHQVRSSSTHAVGVRTQCNAPLSTKLELDADARPKQDPEAVAELLESIRTALPGYECTLQDKLHEQVRACMHVGALRVGACVSSFATDNSACAFP